jgi:ATP-dependent DNA helicase RecQ
LSQTVVPKKIVFLDIEVGKNNKKIYELGLLHERQTCYTTSLQESVDFILSSEVTYICGHNFIDFDLEILKDTTLYHALLAHQMIDTLPLSLLLFSEKSIHALPKNYKQEDDFKNDPVEDSKLTAELLLRLERRFLELDKTLCNIFYSLLKDQKHFHGFFAYMAEKYQFEVLGEKALYSAIINAHEQVIHDKQYLKKVIKEAPVELAYIIALITPHIEIKSHPPRILYLYKEIVAIQKRLCFDLSHEKRALSDFSKETFGFGSFRVFPKLNPSLLSTQVSQKDIIEASLKDESFLAVLPTGGGKTFTFWLPAIIKAKQLKSLTVVISPLQALIEDHVTSFTQKVANYKAVAISGYMSPLQRSEAIEQVISGEADILYLAPESLRSNMIFNVLKNRLIERFVVDEAHCLSTWGNDFRQDYYYICEYINELLEAKGYQEHIPISCFTATAKKDVINDIKDYFKEGLQIGLDEYIAKPERKNLKYKALPSESREKYPALLKLIHEHNGATLVYIPSSTRECDKVADQLAMDTGKSVRSFHSKLDSQVKMQILKEYIDNEIDVIVATTAFGMGVDKADITNVIHYEVSDSLENYAQEAGRGARDENLEAFCPILFDENDLDKHFASLNRSKITAGEINSVFRVIKRAKGDSVTKTAFEIALEAGWDVEDGALDYTTKVKTALLELEREGYISRKRNKVSFFADSVAAKSMEKLHEALDRQKYEEEESSLLVLVLQHILHRGSTMSVQVDELAYLLGAKKADIALAIHRLKELEILGDSKDLSLIIYRHSEKSLQKVIMIEKKLVEYLLEKEHPTVTIKELHSYLHECGIIKKNQSLLITDILRNLRDKSSFIFKRINRQYDMWEYKITDKTKFMERLERKHAISEKIVQLFMTELISKEKEVTVEFSLKSLREKIGKEFTLKSIDKALLYLHHMGCVELLNGRFINYAPMVIHKQEKMKIVKKQYTKRDYRHRLEKHYRSKVEAIHIMGEYSKILQKDDIKAGMFLKDYFSMEYEAFKRKYKLLKEKITRPITQRRYNKIFSEMSDEQKAVIKDRETKAMMILAGPGSGKTKVLVHKIASLILTEDIKPEQFMMLTFSRTAANEFRNRLYKLIGELSYDIEIYTFHAYALKLIGRVVKEGEEILIHSIAEAVRQIHHNDITLPFKSVLVLDEYQDINQDSFELVDAIYRSNQEMRMIAVGDDDQCIMGHIGADPHFIDLFKERVATDDEGNKSYRQYELLTNFRSVPQIVSYSNHFINRIKNRYKLHPLSAYKDEEGKVTVMTCLSTNLITPAVEQVTQQASYQSTAVLAYTNDEVMQIYAALHSKGIGAKYILDREGFLLKNITEIVYFDQILTTLLKDRNSYTEAHFFEAYKLTETKFKGSKNLPLLQKVIDKFLIESLSYYVSQWLAYLDEIRLEDFESYAKTVTVSTIHKSKGMEFENVVMIVNQMPKHDEDTRLYYVGMTRAKKELTIIHHGQKALDKRGDATYLFNETRYDKDIGNAVFIMGLQDIQLGFKGFHNDTDTELLAGEPLELQMRGKASTFALIYKNRVIGFLSKNFHHKISMYLERGYGIHEITIEHVVVWYNQEIGEYLKHPLCRISLGKR